MNTSERVQYRYVYARLFKAMSLEQAKKVLGLPLYSTPSRSDVMKAWRQRAFENHPDRGGDLNKMVEVNVAKDVLTGERPATPEAPPPTSRPEPSAPPQEEEVVEPLYDAATFDEAVSEAGVSISSVYWMWITQFENFEPESFEARVRGALDTGWVAYGRHRDSNDHIFLAIGAGAYGSDPFALKDRMTWWVGNPVRVGKKVPTARAIASGQAKATNQIKGLRKTNVIYAFGPGGRRYIDQQKDIESPSWAPTTIKKWLAESGYGKEVAIKLVVELRQRGNWGQDVVVVINGHDNVFGDRGRGEFLRELAPKIFKKMDLQWGDAKRDITRMRNPGWFLLLIWRNFYDELAPADAEILKKYLQQIGALEPWR